MAKIKKRLTPTEKRAKNAAKAKLKKKDALVFMNGKQVRIKRESTVDGMPLDDVIMKNADPIWLHQNEMWELIPVEEPCFDAESDIESDSEHGEDLMPF